MGRGGLEGCQAISIDRAQTINGLAKAIENSPHETKAHIDFQGFAFSDNLAAWLNTIHLSKGHHQNLVPSETYHFGKHWHLAVTGMNIANVANGSQWAI
jgi:hypothetical protein